MGHSKEELPSTQTEPAFSTDQRPISRIPRLFPWQLMNLKTIITKREKNDSLKESPYWKEAAASMVNFLNISLEGVEILGAKDGKIRCDFDAISGWCKVTNLTSNLETAQKAGLKLQDRDVRKNLVQSWIDYLNGLLTSEEVSDEEVSEPVEPHVPETLLEFLEKAHSELRERAQYELAR